MARSHSKVLPGALARFESVRFLLLAAILVALLTMLLWGYQGAPAGVGLGFGLLISLLVALWWQLSRSVSGPADAQRCDFILANLEQTVLVMNLEGYLTSAHGDSQRLLGYRLDELHGQHASLLSPTQSREATHQAIQTALAGQALPREWMARHRQGHLLPVDVAFVTRHDTQGHPHEVVMVLRDLRPQKEAEAKLQEQSQRFLFFLDAIPHLTWSAHPDGELHCINRNIIRHLGFQPHQVQGDAWQQVIRPEEIERVVTIMQQAEHSRSSYEFELELKSIETGTYRWYRINGSPMLDAAGNILQWYGIATDIDDLVRIRQQSQARERTLRSLADSQKTYLMRTNAEGYFTFANAAFRNAFYQGRNNLEGEYSLTTDTLHPDDVAVCAEAAMACLAQPGVYHNLVLRKPKGDQGYFYTEWEFIGILDDTGGVIEVQGMGRDITLQKEAENERENLALVVENTDHGIVITDAAGYTTWVNAAFTRMSGYTLADLRGKRPAELLASDETDPAALEAIQEAFSLKKPITLEAVNQHRDGHTYWVEVTLQPILDEQGEVKQFFSIERDITGLKQRTQALERMTQDLTRRNQELSEFAYVVSHNLRAPVANILGLTEMLNEQGNQPEPVIQHLNLATQRLDEVIIDLQGLLDLRRGTGEVYQICDLAELLDWVQIQLRHQFERTEAQLRLAVKDAPKVPAILPYLQSILQNLMSNSIKYRHPDRPLEIVVRSRQVEQHIEIAVQDNGLGIDLQHHGRDIFQMYQRFHNHTDGKGLGLYLVKTQVESMGGRIEVQSQPGQGATFLLHLPMRDIAPQTGYHVPDSDGSV